ncbi:MAG TPA: hypothetical protein PLZ74_11055 [Kiritimatiellia bacterium]|nr:hypothetical protein [Kiritimatiellia bacterium]
MVEHWNDSGIASGSDFILAWLKSLFATPKPTEPVTGMKVLNMMHVVLIASIVGMTFYASKLEPSNKPPAIMVWFEDNGIGKVSSPQLVAAVWDNGDMLWSTNTLCGGTPYLYGKVCGAINVGKVIDYFKHKGYFSAVYSRHNMGPDSKHIGMFISEGTNALLTRSWHEIMEQNPNLVALSHGITSLHGRNRETVLEKDKAEYLQYRAMWTDVRSQINAMIPQKGCVIEDVRVQRRRGKHPPTIIWKQGSL